MKFEFQDFYPITEKNRVPNMRVEFIGTVHIYCIDCKLDIRGIKVTKKGSRVYFNLPHVYGNDHETGERVSYPVIRWVDEQTQAEMLDFLHAVVKPQILERLSNASQNV